MTKTHIYPNPQALARAAAESFVQSFEQSIQDHGFFSVALSGGSTPQALYQILAGEPYQTMVDWARVHFFWGDERCVPPNHPDSNFLKANQALLIPVGVPSENVHRIPAELTPEVAASTYEETLLKFFSGLQNESERYDPRFDLVLLGMGDDGHTASLFPGTPAIHEIKRWTAAQYIDKLAAWRITLTPALLNRAKKVIFLVAGASKSDALQHVIYGAYQPDRYPAQIIRPDRGELLWLIDETAASLL